MICESFYYFCCCCCYFRIKKKNSATCVSLFRLQKYYYISTTRSYKCIREYYTFLLNNLCKIRILDTFKGNKNFGHRTDIFLFIYNVKWKYRRNYVYIKKWIKCKICIKTWKEYIFGWSSVIIKKGKFIRKYVYVFFIFCDFIQMRIREC